MSCRCMLLIHATIDVGTQRESGAVSLGHSVLLAASSPTPTTLLPTDYGLLETTLIQLYNNGAMLIIIK